MENDFANLLTSLLCLLPFCLGGLGMLGVGAFLVWIIIRSRQPRDAAALADDWQKMQVEVADLLKQVLPWQDAVLSELRTPSMTRWVMTPGNNFRIRGLIAASWRDKKRAWAAFAARGRRLRRGPTTFHGQAHARTTAHTLDFEAQPEGEVVIRMNGASLGALHADGTLVDSSGETVGHVSPRPEQDTPGQPVTLHGRLVARLFDTRSGCRFASRRQPLPPAVEIVASDLRAEERDWLLALVLWQAINRAVGGVRWE